MVWPISVYTASDVFYLLCYIEKHSKNTVSHLKRLTNLAVVGFSYVWQHRQGPHRESTDSLIYHCKRHLFRAGNRHQNLILVTGLNIQCSTGSQ